MYTDKEKNEFITLRAEGLSFDKISKKLHVPKRTLFRWAQEKINEINSFKDLAFESLMESLKVTTKNRVKMLAEDLYKINVALKERSFIGYNVFDLLKYKMKLISELSQFDSAFKSFDKEYDEDSKCDDIAHLQTDSPLQTCKTLAEFKEAIKDTLEEEKQAHIDFPDDYYEDDEDDNKEDDNDN